MESKVHTEKVSKEIRLKGLTIVSGISIGRPFFYTPTAFKINELTVPQEEIAHEINRYYKALNRSKVDILSLQQQAESQRGGDDIASILKSHLEIIKDPSLTKNVVDTIKNNGKNAEYAVTAVLGEIEERINKTRTSFFIDRLQDIQDVTGRIISHLCCTDRENLGTLDQNIIVISEKLTPSDAACSNPAYIRAFVTEIGAPTSHMAIVSQAKGIPYISGIDIQLLRRLTEDSPLVIVDAFLGEIVINPSVDTLEYYRSKNRSSISVSHKSCEVDRVNYIREMRPQRRVSLNIDSYQDFDMIDDCFPDVGIGLFRTEYLAINAGKFPSEEEQFDIYMKLTLRKAHTPPVIRLFDFGGDKVIPGFNFKERALRLLFRDKSIFESQIKALIRTSLAGPIKLLLPMVADITELRRVKEIIKMFVGIMSSDEKSLVMSNLKIGCMIEVPAAWLMLKELAEECDFFSIGSNDLSQYTLGIGRESGDVDYLNCPLHPAVLRIIGKTMVVAKEHGIPVSLCGEIAANPQFSSLFWGLGLEELSVSPPAFTSVLQTVAKFDFEQARQLADEALKTTTYADLMSLLSSS
ncbi:MAG: phosphoenolpyruvate--protein phosphotransferase [Victivallaceae bacterium]